MQVAAVCIQDIADRTDDRNGRTILDVCCAEVRCRNNSIVCTKEAGSKLSGIRVRCIVDDQRRDSGRRIHRDQSARAGDAVKRSVVARQSPHRRRRTGNWQDGDGFIPLPEVVNSRQPDVCCEIGRVSNDFNIACDIRPLRVGTDERRGPGRGIHFPDIVGAGEIIQRAVFIGR